MQYWTQTQAGHRVKLPFCDYIKAHHISRAALTAGVLVAAIVFFVVGAGLRLLWGPVSLGPLKDALAGAIHEALPGINLDYDRAAIEWSRDQGRVRSCRAGHASLRPQGTGRGPCAQSGDRSGARRRSCVASSWSRASRWWVSEFALVHMKSGRIRLGTQQHAGDDDIIGRLSDVIDARSSGSSSLESFAVRDAKLAIYDEVSGLTADLAARARSRSDPRGRRSARCLMPR